MVVNDDVRNRQSTAAGGPRPVSSPDGTVSAVGSRAGRHGGAVFLRDVRTNWLGTTPASGNSTGRSAAVADRPVPF